MIRIRDLISCSGIALAVALGAAGCSSSKEAQIPPVDELHARAMAEFQDESYLEAIEDFKSITVQYQGSAFADDAQFYLAECRYLRGEYVLAAAEYDILIRMMPSSPYVPRARYQKALCYYHLSPKPQLDQRFTLQAIEEFQTFIEYSPTDTLVKSAEVLIEELNNKLALKEYESGRLYYRMEYYRAAIKYFDNVLERFHDTAFADDAMLGKAQALVARKEYETARQTLADFFARYPSSSLIPEARELQREIETSLQKARS